MDYRDDREALRLRAEQLERERDEAKEALERQKEEAKREIARVKGEAKRRGRRTPDFRPKGALWVVVTVCGGAGVIAFAVLGTPSTTPTVTPTASVATPAAPAPPAPAPLDRRVSATWEGAVKTATGRDLANGTPCRLVGRFASDGTSRVEADVDVECGGATLYRWADPIGTGMEMRQCNVWEGPAETLGSLRYKLRCQDQGVRSGGRPQLTVDTFSESVVVWHDAPPTWRVEIEVPEYSPSIAGAPLYLGNLPSDAGFREPVERRGAITTVSGPAPVRNGARCTLRVQPTAGRYNCRIQLECGGAAVYGAGDSGYTACTVEGGRPVRASDVIGSAIEGDPKLEMDLGSGNLVVADDPASGPWSVTVALEPTGTAPGP